MKKMTKKLGAIVLALAMCFSLCATALAAGECSITIDNSMAGSTYYVYKIFDATYDPDSDAVSYTIAADSPWLSLIQSTDGQKYFTTQAVYAADGETVSYYAVQRVSSTLDDDDGLIAWLTSCISVDDSTGTATLPDGGEITPVYENGTRGNGGSIKIDGLDSGYYFVSTTTGSAVSVTTAAPNATIIDKNSTISVDKEMIINGQAEDETASGMDEDIDFDIKATVPKYEGTNVVVDYTFTDTLSNGLLIEFSEEAYSTMVEAKEDSDGTTHYYLTETALNSWVTLYDGAGTPVAGKGTDVSLTGYLIDYSFELIGYDVYTDETGNAVHTFDGFVFNYYTFDYEKFSTDYHEALEKWLEENPGKTEDDFDFDAESYYVSNYPSNASIEIQYKAHVSSLEGYDNTNDVVLEHEVMPWRHPHDNPTPGQSYDGHNDVYSWELQLVKVDGETTTPLEGATFKLESDNMKSVTVGHSYLYVTVAELDELGETGTYTDTKTGNTYKVADFESTNYYLQEDETFGLTETDDGPYHRILTDKDTEVVESAHYAEGITDDQGKIYFAGLGEGDYTLTEIIAPDGYNLLTDPIEFTITWSEEKGFEVTYAEGSSGSTAFGDGYLLTMQIENNAGTELPSTGGIGTTIFYIIGGVLVVGAVVVLVTRRRMTREG